MDPITLVLRSSKVPAASAPVGGELSSAEIDANWSNLKTAAEQLASEKAPLVKWISNTAPNPAAHADWWKLDGTHFVWDGTTWFQPPGTPGQDGAPAAIVRAAVSVTPAKFGQAEVSVAAVGALSTHTVICQLVPNADWDADDLAGFSVIGVAGTDAITFTILAIGPIVGDFSIAYQIG